MRLNRYIAQAGIGSRRKADEMISAGLVKINGQVVTTLGVTVTSGDEIIVNGKRITPERLDYLLLNKPPDTITTRSDDRDRPTVMDLVADEGKRVRGLFPVGRLDRNTTGALLITNDGDLAHRLMHPSFEFPKIYVVETKETVTEAQLAALAEGLTLEDGPIKPRNVAYVGNRPGRSVAIELHEGRNRIVRRMIAAIGHDIRKLDRVGYGPLNLKGLRRGKWRRLTKVEIARLRRAAGIRTR